MGRSDSPCFRIAGLRCQTLKIRESMCDISMLETGKDNMLANGVHWEDVWVFY